jgi:hypothetical protein
MNTLEIFSNRANIFFVMRLVVGLIFFEFGLGFLYGYFGISLGSEVDTWPLAFTLFGTIILAPVLETWLCQYLFFKLAQWIGARIGNTPIGTIFIGTSSLFFAVMHNDSIWFMLYALFAGIALAYCFLHFFNLYRSLIISFWFTAMLHALFNSAILLVDSLIMS